MKRRIKGKEPLPESVRNDREASSRFGFKFVYLDY